MARQQEKQKQQAHQRRKQKKALKQCIKLKETKSQGHAQLASGVVPDTLWQTTIAGILVVTAASLDISKNKQF
jgi:hypothetical protein